MIVIGELSVKSKLGFIRFIAIFTWPESRHSEKNILRHFSFMFKSDSSKPSPSTKKPRYFASCESNGSHADCHRTFEAEVINLHAVTKRSQ